MIKGLQPKPLVEVGKLFAKYLGKDWCRDRDEIVDIINEFREYLHIDLDITNLFDEKFYCLELSCYNEDCVGTCKCGNTFRGFTLPSDMDGILDVWIDNEPLRTHSKWWEGRVGKITGDEITNSVIPTNRISPLRRAMTKAGDLYIHSDSPDDNGKEVVIEYIDCIDDVTKIRVALDNLNPKIIPSVFGVISISSSSSLVGKWTLSQEDGYELGEYTKHNSIPQYEIMKVSSDMCKCSKVLVRGNQKFEPVCFDYDIVEVGYSVIIKHASRMFTYEESLDSPSANKSERDRLKMIALIDGALKRKRGHQKEDAVLRRSHKLVVNKLSYRR